MNFYSLQRKSQGTVKKISLIILCYLVLIAILIVYFKFHHSSVNLSHGVYIDKPLPIAHFELTDNKGHLFTEHRLGTTWSLLFFGFSTCKMICPLTLHMLDQTYKSLPKTKRPQIIFVSVDPEQDTLERLNQFVHQFNAHFIALRGTMSAINTLQKQLHVPVSMSPMSHGAEIVLINPDSKIQAYFFNPLTAKELLFDLNQLID